MMKEVTAIVSGRVQMVMYRDFAQRKARRHGITGTVQNLSDGTVEVHAQGEEQALARFLEKLHTGPVLARVDNVAIEETDLQNYKGFKILF